PEELPTPSPATAGGAHPGGIAGAGTPVTAQPGRRLLPAEAGATHRADGTGRQADLAEQGTRRGTLCDAGGPGPRQGPGSPRGPARRPGPVRRQPFTPRIRAEAHPDGDEPGVLRARTREEAVQGRIPGVRPGRFRPARGGPAAHGGLAADQGQEAVLSPGGRSPPTGAAGPAPPAPPPPRPPP